MLSETSPAPANVEVPDRVRDICFFELGMRQVFSFVFEIRQWRCIFIIRRVLCVRGFLAFPFPFVVSQRIDIDYVGVATGALATVQEIGGTVGLSLVGAIIRTIEKSKLSFELNKEGLQLSPTTQDKIRSLLSSFEELQAYLSHMSSLMHAKILKAFSTSFMYGYRGAMWLLVAIAAFAILSIFFLTRNAKKVSQKD